MGKLVIADLDAMVEERLRQRAAAHGRSPEQEAREIISVAVGAAPRPRLSDLAQEIFGAEHGVHLDLPSREKVGEPPFR